MRFWLGLILFFILFGCGPWPSEPNEYQKNGYYPLDCEIPVAVLMMERNGMPFAFGSAFLVEQRAGFFTTAKHVVENLVGRDFKIFFHCKVYGGIVSATSSIADVAVVQIKDSFNPDSFPDALILSGEQIKVSETVKIWGAHPHPPNLLADKKLVGIYRGYYGMSWSRDEFVFDDLTAKIGNLNLEVQNKDIEGTPKGFEFVSNTYIEVITVEDHHFSFGGLSGGPAVDEKGRVIGIVAAGMSGGNIMVGFHFDYIPWNKIYITPTEELHKLLTSLSLNEK